MEDRIEGILLAAGQSRRMGYPKPLLRLQGETFLAHTAATMLSVVERLVIVLGAERQRLAAAVPADGRIRVVENPEYERGQLSSIKAGISALSAPCSAAIVHLVDHPLVEAETFRLLAARYRSSRQPIVVTRCEGRRGHPVLFAAAVFDELRRASEQIGARAVVDLSPQRVSYVDVGDRGVLLDLDTPDDLAGAGLGPVPKS